MLPERSRVLPFLHEHEEKLSAALAVLVEELVEDADRFELGPQLRFLQPIVLEEEIPWHKQDSLAVLDGLCCSYSCETLTEVFIL